MSLTLCFERLRLQFTYIENIASDQTCLNIKRVLAFPGWIFLGNFFYRFLQFSFLFLKIFDFSLQAILWRPSKIAY